MALLPPSPLKLTGGCMCSSIRYTVSIPSLPLRPLVPSALPTPINPLSETETVPTRFPLIDIDHCTDCRRACGGLLQCWLICPQEWVEFTLQSRAPNSTETQTYICASITHPSPATLSATHLAHYESSPGIHRCFCSRCGTGLTYASSRDRGPSWTLGPIVDVAVGSLDQESIERVRPERHGWWESGTSWVKEMVEGKSGWLIRHPEGRVSRKVEDEKPLGM